MKRKFAVAILIGCMTAGMMTGCAALKNAGVLEADAAATLKMAKDNKTEGSEAASTLTTEDTDQKEGASDKKDSEDTDKKASDEPMTLESTEKDPGSQVTVAADAATLTVTGSGTATVTPDKASISIGVQTVDPSSKTAQDKNSKDVNNVIDVLINAGVDEKDITTSSFDLYANYDYSKDVSELTGYTVTTMLTVKNLKVDDVGELLDDAGDAGVNVINGISFDYSETEAAYDQALDAAMDRAQEKAQKLAEKEGCRLEKILSVQEGNDTGYSSTRDAKEYGAANAGDTGMNVMPGEDDVTATVTVTYQLVQN